MNNFKFREKFVAASFLISVILFILLRFYLEDKRYAFLAFLLVPLAPFLVGLKKIKITYPLLIIILYLVLGFTLSWWHPGWVLFITIPIFYIFFPNKEDDDSDKLKRVKKKDNDIYID